MVVAYTRPLVRTALGNGVEFLSGPVPAGQLWVIRDVTIYNGGPTGVDTYLSIRSQGVTYPLATLNTETGKSLHMDLRQAMLSGSQIRLVAVGTGIVASVTGYVLDDT